MNILIGIFASIKNKKRRVFGIIGSILHLLLIVGQIILIWPIIFGV
jgi:hypothetical protein